LGTAAGYTNATGGHNTFVGSSAGYGSNGYDNTYVGYQSGYSYTFNVTGSSNTFIGSGAGYANTTGNANTFFGTKAGNANTIGNTNAFIGSFAGELNTSGSSNTFIGDYAGLHNITGSGNVFLGYSAGNNETGSNKLYVDNCVYGGGFNCTNPLIYGEFDNRIVKINGTLFMASDERLKGNIEPLRASLDKVMRLQGVSFEWRREKNLGDRNAKSRDIGLIAQEVEKVMPELVHTDGKGYKAIAYDKLVPVLIEAIKEQQIEINDQHKEINDKDARIERLEKALEKMERRMVTLEGPSKTFALK